MDGGFQQPDRRRGSFRAARSHREQQRGERERVTNRGVVTVVPVTGNIRRVYLFQVRLAARDCGLRRDSKARAEQIRAVALNAFAIAWAASPRGA